MNKMTKVIGLSLSLIVAISITACKDRSAANVVVEKPVSLSLNSTQMLEDNSTIITDKSTAVVNLLGEKGTSVYVNGEKYSDFDDSGSMNLSLHIDHIGSTNYEIVLKDNLGKIKDAKIIQVIRKSPNASLGIVSTKGAAKDLTLSQNGTMFVAEGQNGVELITIGFDDRISSDILASISNIDALSVTLSGDEKTLFIQDKEHNYHAYDISNPNEPLEIGVVDAKTIKKSKISISKDNQFQIRVSPCGLIAEDIIKDNLQRKFILKDKSIKDAILVNDDKDVLTAHSEDGLFLYSLQENGLPTLKSKKKLDSAVYGLSVIEKSGILFVAKGEKGVEIFNLDILLSQMK